MKTKKTAIVMGTLFLLGSFTSAFANPARRSMGPISYFERALQNADSGTRVGGSEGQEYFAFCRSSHTTLTQYKEIFLSIYQRGNTQRAILKSVEGLQRALQLESGSGVRIPTFTQKAILLALEVMTPLLAELSELDERSLNSIIRYVDAAYTFITNDVINSLDINIYLPMVTRRTRCTNCQSEIERFERSYITYAQKSLDLLKNTMVSETIMDRSRIFYTLGPSRQYLQMAKAHLLHTASELEQLNQGLFPNRFSCQKERLLLTASNIEAYLHAEESPYTNEILAVNFVTRDLINTSTSLSQAQCNF